MPKTSTCPSCQEPVTLVDVPPASLVECPLCLSQFELRDALDFVADSDEEDGPPEIMVVEIREAATPSENAENSDEGEFTEFEEAEDGGEKKESGPDSPGEDGSCEALPEDPVEVRCPCCGDSFALQDLLLATTNEPIGSGAASAIFRDGSIREPAGGPTGIKIDLGGPAIDHSDFRLQSVEGRPTPAAGAFEFAPPVGADSAGVDKPESGRIRRSRRERGGLKDLVGAIVGGAAGLLITYYLLNLIGGPRFDILRVYLPGVKHTTVHRPGWLGGPPEDEFDSGIGAAVGQVQEPPKPAETPKSESNAQKKPENSPDAQVPSEVAAEEPLPSQETLPADLVGLLDPPQPTSEELGQALREVDRLAKAGPLTEEAYEMWCRVAAAATFIDRVDGNPQTQGRLDAMQRLLKDLSIDDVAKIGQLATRRTGDPDRASHGILLAGSAHNPNTPKGKGFMTGLKLADTGAQVVLASDRKLPIQPDDRILVLGYLVDRPKEAIQGLDTELPQIIWFRTVAKFGG